MNEQCDRFEGATRDFGTQSYLLRRSVGVTTPPAIHGATEVSGRQRFLKTERLLTVIEYPCGRGNSTTSDA